MSECRKQIAFIIQPKKQTGPDYKKVRILKSYNSIRICEEEFVELSISTEKAMADAEAKLPDYRLLLCCPSGLSPSQVLISLL